MSRLDLPKILRRLQRGKRFRLVVRPVSDLPPIRKDGEGYGGIYDLLARPYGEIHLGRGENAETAIRADRD